uniref:F-box domain-containing protein n=1 Tax=Timema cristinae TaxID=61476 RepID=A0A7R9H794_TIMCR|nr:unnamed protein product [Timema cristinae]
MTAIFLTHLEISDLGITQLGASVVTQLDIPLTRQVVHKVRMLLDDGVEDVLVCQTRRQQKSEFHESVDARVVFVWDPRYIWNYVVGQIEANFRWNKTFSTGVDLPGHLDSVSKLCAVEQKDLKMSCRRGIEDFPDELLLKIFSYLTTEELVLRLPHVTHSWDILSQDSSLWEQRCFEPRPQTTDKQIIQTLQISDLELCAEGVVRPIAESCPCLEHVDLGHESESDEIRHEDLVYLLEHKKADLKTMTITYNDWSEHTRALFEQCTQLEELHIYSWNNTRESNLTFIGKPTNLCALSLRQMSHFESSLSHLLQNYDWSNLTKLDLANHYNLGNESLSCIYQNCANIEYLCVEMCENLTDEGFEHISKCKNLYHLNQNLGGRDPLDVLEQSVALVQFQSHDVRVMSECSSCNFQSHDVRVMSVCMGLTLGYTPRVEESLQYHLSHRVSNKVEMERILAVEQNGLDEGYNGAARVITRTNNGYVDHLTLGYICLLKRYNQPRVYTKQTRANPYYLSSTWCFKRTVAVEEGVIHQSGGDHSPQNETAQPMSRHNTRKTITSSAASYPDCLSALNYVSEIMFPFEIGHHGDKEGLYKSYTTVGHGQRRGGSLVLVTTHEANNSFVPPATEYSV